MPREDRRIIFSYDEVYKAIYALCVQRELKKPPPGVIMAVEPSTYDPSKVAVRLDNPHIKGPIVILEYGLDFLAAALMLYCRTLRIPLPKTASKAVELSTDGVILRVMI